MPFLIDDKVFLPDHPERLDEANSLLEYFLSKRQPVITRQTLPISTPLGLNLQGYLQLTVHRVVDLCEGICESWNSRRPSAAFVLVRAVVENAVAFNDVTEHIASSVKRKDLDEITPLIERRLFGGKGIQASYPVPNILTSVNKIAKSIPLFRFVYDEMSEYVHPNFNGMMGLYGIIDAEAISVTFTHSKACQRMPELLVTFVLGLTVLRHSIEESGTGSSLPAPKTIDPLQQTVATVLQGHLNSAIVIRKKIVDAIKYINQPLTGVQVKTLRSAYQKFQASHDIGQLVGDVEGLAETYGSRQQSSARPSDSLTRENLKLVCFDYLSG